jgi:hypothetical protein
MLTMVLNTIFHVIPNKIFGKFDFVRKGSNAFRSGQCPGVASVWEREKLEAGKMIDAKRAAESPLSTARFVGQLSLNFSKSQIHIVNARSVLFRPKQSPHHKGDCFAPLAMTEYDGQLESNS